MIHDTQDERKHQPVIKIVGLPRSLGQVSKRGQTPDERRQQIERTVKNKVWIVRTWESYKSKKQDTGGNADGNNGVDNAFPDLQRSRFLLFPLPNQQTGAHHEGQKYTRNHARPGAEIRRGRGKMSGEKG